MHSGARRHTGIWRFFLVVFCFTASVYAGPECLRVLSLNVEWFPGMVPNPAPAQQARHIVGLQLLLHDLNPDLWLVQEVNRADALNKVLAVLPGTRVYTVSAFTNGPHQLAIAGRLPVIDAGTAEWQDVSTDTSPPRGVAYSVVEFSDRSVLLVFTLHLKSNFRAAENYDASQNIAMRENAAKLFVKYVKSIKATITDRTIRGMLVGGDFNVLYPASLFRGEQTSRIFKEGGFEYLGGNALDHFWGTGITNAVFTVHPDHRVSDHFAITLDIPLPEGIALLRLPPRPPAEVAGLAGNVKTNVNTAPLQELMALPGIGPVLAGRITVFRPFQSVEELALVCRIGPITFKQIQPWIEFSTSETP